MSAVDWKYFVSSAKSNVLGKFGKHVTKLVDCFGKHVTKLVDCERNERAGKGDKT